MEVTSNVSWVVNGFFHEKKNREITTVKMLLFFFLIFGTFGLLVDSRNLFHYFKKLLPQIFYEKATRRQFLAEKSHVTLARKLRSKRPEKISSNYSVHCFLAILKQNADF